MHSRLIRHSTELVNGKSKLEKQLIAVDEPKEGGKKNEDNESNRSLEAGEKTINEQMKIEEQLSTVCCLVYCLLPWSPASR